MTVIKDSLAKGSFLHRAEQGLDFTDLAQALEEKMPEISENDLKTLLAEDVSSRLNAEEPLLCLPEVQLSEDLRIYRLET